MNVFSLGHPSSDPSLQELQEDFEDNADHTFNLPNGSATTILSTLITLYPNSTPSDSTTSTNIFFEPDYLTVIPESVRANHPEGPQSEIRDYLINLVRCAHTVANAHSCSSVLAGAGSESDEFGDVAFWLGDTEISGGEDAISHLGLSHWISDPSQMTVSESLPMLFNTPALAQLFKEVDRVERVTIQNDQHGAILHIIIGRLISGDNNWIGIMGLGTTSD